MELKIKGKTFYLLDADNDKRIYDDESKSVKALESIISQKEDIDPESIDIMEVNMGERWEIESVPWTRIVIWENAKSKREKLRPRLFNANVCIRNSPF